MSRVSPPSLLFRKLSRPAVAVDLGTANTLIHTAEHGIVLDQPSVVCYERRTADSEATVAAVGREAKDRVGREPLHVETVRPLSHGVIADFPAAGHMMSRFVAMAAPRRLLARRVPFTVCVSASANQVERHAIRETAFAAGAAHVSLIGQTLAAALGAGLPVSSATASMVVDIGGGTTEVGIIALGGVAHSGSARVGGDEFDRAILHYVRGLYGVALGEQTAEHVKKTIGSALRGEPVQTLRATGRSLADGLPRTMN